MEIRNGKRFMNVAEASRVLRLTRQSIYARVNGIWQEHSIKNEQGFTLIDTAVLTAEQLKELEHMTEVTRERRTTAHTHYGDIRQQLIDKDRLLTSKDEHITTLQNEVEYLKLQNDKLQEQLQNLQKLLNQQQQLQGQLQQRLLEAPATNQEQQDTPGQKEKKRFSSWWKK